MLVRDSSHENCRQHNSSGETGMASIPQKTTYSVAAAPAAGRGRARGRGFQRRPSLRITKSNQCSPRESSRTTSQRGGRPFRLQKSANLLAEEREEEGGISRLGLASEFLGFSYLLFNRDFVSSRSLRGGQCTSIKCNRRRAGKSASIVETWCMAPQTSPSLFFPPDLIWGVAFLRRGRMAPATAGV